MAKCERAAREFLAPWHRRAHVTGALVCGSYVTGHPTPRSDIDVQILLAPGTRWRERGNRVVDGFLIEYFANSAKQIRAYWKNDHAENRRLTATMFVTGRILFDEDGQLKRMISEARRWRRKPLPSRPRTEHERAMYSIWDDVDNLHDAAERGAADVPFQYYHGVRFVYETYARFLRQPVLQVDRILGCFRRGGHPEKYLLDAFPDPDFPPMLLRAIREMQLPRMPGRLERLAHYVQQEMGGFEVDGWTFRTPSV